MHFFAEGEIENPKTFIDEVIALAKKHNLECSGYAAQERVIEKQEDCPVCGGKGWDEDDNDCVICKGTGLR
jgi:DnaJ-class molecular chaperone